MFKYIYPNHAFRDASIGYGDPPAIPPKERLATPAAATAWLKEAHAYLIEAIDELPDDQELERPRKARLSILRSSSMRGLAMATYSLAWRPSSPPP